MHQQYNTNTQFDTPTNTLGDTNETATSRDWLAQWPIARRSLISNLFHYAAREGATTPAHVVRAVQTALRRRLGAVPHRRQDKL